MHLDFFTPDVAQRKFLRTLQATHIGCKRNWSGVGAALLQFFRGATTLSNWRLLEPVYGQILLAPF